MPLMIIMQNYHQTLLNRKFHNERVIFFLINALPQLFRVGRASVQTKSRFFEMPK